jgi:hypothetical protein
MKGILTVILLALPTFLFAQTESLMQEAITRPVLSARCKELFKERSEKIGVQQKYNSLLQRTEDMLKKSPENKDGVKARLSSTRVKIKNELHLTNLQIETMEENIVRSGCPGLSL